MTALFNRKFIISLYNFNQINSQNIYEIPAK